MIQRGRIGTLVLLLFTIACSGGGGTATPGATPGASTSTGTPSAASPSTTAEPGSPFTEVTEPIVGVVPAADIDEDGQPIDPGFRFSADAPQVTIVAQLGEVAAPSVDFAWFQVTDDGETELFTHSVQVSSNQTAYSVGTNPGTLSVGTYRVEATLQGETGSTTFEVETGVVALLVGFMGEGAPSGPPASGDSGALGPRGPDTSASTFLAAWLSQEPVDPGARDIILEVNAGIQGGGGRVEAYVEMAGNLRSISIPTNESGFVISYLSFEPCVHPGGSDLPGTTAEFTTNLFGEDPRIPVVDSVTHNTELGQDQTHPEVDIINEQPPRGSRVNPGDEIVLNGSARETRTGPTWQTGLNSFKLVDYQGGLIGEEQRSDAGSPQPCDLKQWTLDSQATYIVPDDPPPVMNICGTAVDFAGNELSTCIDYSTGEVWFGTVKSVVTVPGPSGQCGNQIPIEGTAEFVVGDDGTVTGTYDVTGCGVSEPHAEFTGTVTDDAFLFPDLIVFANGEPIPKLTPTHAQGTFTNQQGPETTWVTTWDMSCVTCQ